MADIELVIKIPEEEYEMIVNSEDCGLHTLTRAIARGAILSKEHGRLVDADAYSKIIELIKINRNIEYEKSIRAEVQHKSVVRSKHDAHVAFCDYLINEINKLAESQCSINRREVLEGNGYCYMYGSQESEDKA